MRGRVLLFLLGLAAMLFPSVSPAAIPATGTAGPGSSTLTYKGSPTTTSNPAGTLFGLCSELDPACDSFRLNVVAPPSGSWSFTVRVTMPAGEDYDLFLFGPDGRLIDSSGNGAGDAETVSVNNPESGTYRIGTLAWLVTPLTQYDATIEFKGALTSTDPATVLWQYNNQAPQASVEVPLRVVMVGFHPGEVDTSKILSEIPSYQRPGVLIPRGKNPTADGGRLLGNDTLINHARAYYNNTKPFLVPYEYRWKPQVVFAPSGFTSGLFSAMMANSFTGNFAVDSRRQYLEKYNAERGVYRGTGSQVPANAPVRFVDGEKTEDWIAANSKAHLGFDFAARGKGPGANPGYTVFVLNTWDSAEARAIIRPQNQYHVFRVARIDPDSKDFDGVDWARVWGGRYRFMMLDLGAAPNGYEAETWTNRNRTVWGSALYDPPLWEYRAESPRPVTAINIPSNIEQAVTPGAKFDSNYMQTMLARTINQAVSFRFLHSYLYEPWPGTGQFWFSENVWHDAKAEVPWASDLSKLYDQTTVLNGLRTLAPYFSISGDVKFQYLKEGGADYTADQAMLDEAKSQGAVGDQAGVPFTAMHTVVAMDYLDSKPERFLRGAPCHTPVPGISVVVEGHYAWYLPLIAAGVATNREGVPWGYLNSVNDLTKSSHADKDPMLQAAHPQAFRGAFTYTAIHEASHFLGLAHPHDSVGATRNADGSPRYYDGFTWAYNTTAAPTTYSHSEIVYSILDQESIARGHSAYYLKWTDEALADAGEAYHLAGTTTVDKLPRRAAALRKNAIEGSKKAETLFAKFDFVNAVSAAQSAWRSAAAYRDMARNLTPGTTELEKGTRLAGASGCASAKR